MSIRASLVALVYDKALKISSDVSDANKVVTIMGTDIDGVSGAGEMLHETWGQFAELVTGMILLAREVKWLWPLPLAIIVGMPVSNAWSEAHRSRYCSVISGEQVRWCQHTDATKELDRSDSNAHLNAELNAGIHEKRQGHGVGRPPGRLHNRPSTGGNRKLQRRAVDELHLQCKRFV